MFFDVAASAGDSVFVDGITPGGFRFLNHSSNAATLSKIASKDWDYVALQAQSQEPSWPIGQVQQDVFPHAAILCDSIRANNACSMPVFYMTWGRKNGDASNCSSWPPVCTYEGMDSLLNERYQMMADDNDALVSPVGAVWYYIRDNFPLIELYSPDESHPSVAGTYAAACAFYATVLRKDPTLITFDAGLPASDALKIRQAAKLVVNDDFLNWNVGKYSPKADFSVVANQNNFTATFTNLSINGDKFTWYFGDGDSSMIENPVHNYANCIFQVSLKTEKCNEIDVKNDTISFTVGINDISNKVDAKVYPNPSSNYVNVEWKELKNRRDLRLQLYSSNGVLVTENDMSKGVENYQFDVSGLSAGFYFITLNDGTTIYFNKSIEVTK